MADGRTRRGAPIVIAGTGGFARETADALRAHNAGLGPRARRLVGFLDDDPDAAVHGHPVLGPIAAIHGMPGRSLVVCIGNPRGYFARALIVARLGLPDARYASVIHPLAAVSASSAADVGSVLLAGATLTADARIGRHVAVMPQAVVTHDCVVEDFATLASGVRLGGGCRIGRGAYVGAGALIREGVTVGAWSLIGMGSVVLEDIGPGEVWVGNPARRLRDVEIPADLATATPDSGPPVPVRATAPTAAVRNPAARAAAP